MYELIKDQSFDINHTNEYIISIQISLDGFSFSIIQPKKNQLLAIQQLPVIISSENFLGRRFNEWIENEQLLQKRFAEIQILYYTQKFTFIPSEFYHHEKQNEIARLLFGDQDGYSCRDNYLPNTSCNLVFSIANSFIEVSGQKFPDHKLKHPITILNRKIQDRLRDNENTLALYFEKKSFCLLLYCKEKFQLSNSFNYFHINDVIFFILSVLKEQRMSYKNVKMLIAGEITVEGELYNSLKNYFDNIDLFIPEINRNSNIFKESLHRFITLC